MSVQQKILSNNIILVTEPIATLKTVAIGFWFPVGSVNESYGAAVPNAGATHYVEHMLFKGTQTKSAFDIARSFDQIGGYINAFTERDTTCLYAIVPALRITYALQIMCEMVTDSVFAEEELEKERKVIESEIIASHDDPEESAFDAVYAALWKDQSISRAISASEQDVKKLTRDDILYWYKKYFQNGKLVVTISGNVDIDEVERILSMQPVRNHDEADYYVADSVWSSGQSLITAPFQQNQIFAAYPLSIPFKEQNCIFWTLLNAIIGDTMSSRLFQRIREDQGYCYNVYSFFSVYTNAGLVCAYAAVEKNNTERVIDELHEELKKLVTYGVTEKELHDAKEHVWGEEIIASEDVESRMKRLARFYFSGYSLCSPEEYIEKIRSVTVADLNEELVRVIDEKQEALVVYGRKYAKKR